MSKKSEVVFVAIKWDFSRERMRLDLEALRQNPKQSVTTMETILDEGKHLMLSPRASYKLVDGKTHLIRLEYLHKDHPKLKNGDYIWGVSTIRINASLTKARARWKCEVKNKKYDGRASVCTVRIEAPSKRTPTEVMVRTGQQLFKSQLLEIGDSCELSEESLPELLDAAHIQEVKDNGPDAPENGILLRADLHRLYDAGYFVIKSDGRLKQSKYLPPEYRNLLEGKRVCNFVMKRIAPYLAKRTRKLL